jgi:hypothetical protein
LLPSALLRRALILLCAWGLLAVGALGNAGCGGGGSAPSSSSSSTSATATTAPPTRTAAPTTTTTATTSAAGAVSYGLGDGQGTWASCVPTDPDCCAVREGTCRAQSMGGEATAPLLTELEGPRSAHRISEVRMFVAYDAVQEFNGSTTAPGCRYSRVLDRNWYDGAGRLHLSGESWKALVAGLVQAHAQGLTPLVAISGYGSPEAMPAWDEPAPDPTTTAGYWEYRCGVQGIMSALSQLPAALQPHAWEAFNEPDGFRVFRSLDGRQATGCPVGAVGQPDGAAKAACLYPIAADTIHGFAGHAQDTVIAGTFIHPSVDYLGTYAAAMARLEPGAAFPATWSVHDYRDVSADVDGSAPTELAAFDQALATDSGGRAQDLWVTEAGTLLTDHQHGGDCPAVGAMDAGTLGACLQGQAATQAASAREFFALPAAGTAVPITHLFWYEWQAEPNWDSGLVDAAGAPRPQWCVFYGSGACTGSLLTP